MRWFREPKEFDPRYMRSFTDRLAMPVFCIVVFGPFIYLGYLMVEYDHGLVKSGAQLFDDPAGGIVLLVLFFLLLCIGNRG